MIATESSELSKLSGNIDSYPNWDNDIHKRLKMKYYSDDVDQRLENLKKSDVANLDYNNRYFPPLYIDTPTPESMAKEIILQKIMSLKDNNSLVPTSDSNNRVDTSAMAEVNKDKMDEAITEYKEKISLDNLDQVEEPAQEAAYVAPIGKSSKQITGSKNPARAQTLIPAAIIRKKMYPKTYEGLNENETNESVKMLMNDDRLRERSRQMSAQGLKIPKTKSALINRFNLLKGQICSGNDNPAVVTEIKAISKELYNKGLLDKHL